MVVDADADGEDILNAEGAAAAGTGTDAWLGEACDLAAGVCAGSFVNGAFELYEDSMNLRVLSRTRSSTRCFCKRIQSIKTPRTANGNFIQSQVYSFLQRKENIHTSSADNAARDLRDVIF